MILIRIWSSILVLSTLLNAVPLEFYSDLINREKYIKVSSILPVDVNDTLLSSTPVLGNYIKYSCLGTCTRTLGCILACYNDQECSLYWAVVSKRFDPNGFVSNAMFTLNYKCYSSWHFSNEITGNVVAMTSSTLHGTYFREYSINGFYGFGSANTFHTSKVVKPWIQYDFGQIVQIQKILVRARNLTGLFYNTWFDNVEARVGNVSSDGDFTGFALLDHYISSSGDGELIVFEGSAPLWGRYISLQSIIDLYFFCIANVNFLGHT